MPDKTFTYHRESPAAGHAALRALVRDPDDDRRVRRLVWTCSVCGMFAAAALFGMFTRHRGKHSEPVRQATTLVPVAFIAHASSAPANAAAGSADNDSHSPALIPAPPVTLAVVPSDVDRPNPAVTMLRPAPESVLPQQPAASKSPPVASQFEPAPAAAFTPQPVYPSAAQRRGQQGTVRIEFTVQPGGQLADVRITRSSGVASLDAAALTAVRDTWRFPAGPARHHFVDIVFQLK